jgi:hypothetical protein
MSPEQKRLAEKFATLLRFWTEPMSPAQAAEFERILPFLMSNKPVRWTNHVATYDSTTRRSPWES